MSKGSKQRPYDKAKFDSEFDRIFGVPADSELPSPERSEDKGRRLRFDLLWGERQEDVRSLIEPVSKPSRRTNGKG